MVFEVLRDDNLASFSERALKAAHDPEILGVAGCTSSNIQAGYITLSEIEKGLNYVIQVSFESPLRLYMLQHHSIEVK